MDPGELQCYYSRDHVSRYAQQSDGFTASAETHLHTGYKATLALFILYNLLTSPSDMRLKILKFTLNFKSLVKQ
jgi:hypothetical protein